MSRIIFNLGVFDFWAGVEVCEMCELAPFWFWWNFLKLHMWVCQKIEVVKRSINRPSWHDSCLGKKHANMTWSIENIFCQ